MGRGKKALYNRSRCNFSEPGRGRNVCLILPGDIFSTGTAVLPRGVGVGDATARTRVAAGDEVVRLSSYLLRHSSSFMAGVVQSLGARQQSVPCLGSREGSVSQSDVQCAGAVLPVNVHRAQHCALHGSRWNAVGQSECAVRSRRRLEPASL